MGLDMYLTRRKYIGAEYRDMTGSVVSIKIKGKEIPINVERITYIDESVCYWRKANAIHKWFVDNVQEGNDDCKRYNVELEDLKKLLRLCKKVKEKAIIKDGVIKNGETLKNGKWEPNMIAGKYIENAEEISRILPTQEGFFFGNTDYNEWYIDDIDNTIKQLEKLVKEEEELNNMGIYSDYEYHSSW